jgi:hypothetical protein
MDYYELFKKVIQIVERHLDFVLAIFGALFAWYTYRKTEKDNNIQKLAKEVIAFYCIEQEAIKMLKEKMGDIPEQTIQRELRKRALNNENNLEGVRPDMSANSARKYL